MPATNPSNFPAQLQELMLRNARSVLDAPRTDREAAYARLRLHSFVDAKAQGQSARDATRWAARVETCTKALVAKMEAASGASTTQH